MNYSAQEEPAGSADHNPYDYPARFVSREHSAEANLPVPPPSPVLRERIDQKYQTILARGNVEDPMGNLTSFHYPSKGALIRPPYTSYAHYLHVLDMCERKTGFDFHASGSGTTFCGAQRLSAAYPQQHRGSDVRGGGQRLEFELNFNKIDIVLMGWWRDRWAIASQNQGDKGICYLAGNNADPQQWLQSASIRQIEFYQQRFQLLFESFINEPRRKLRPGGLQPLLDIFRAWHNLCYQDKQGFTAAQNLGVTQHPLTLKELLS